MTPGAEIEQTLPLRNRGRISQVFVCRHIVTKEDDDGRLHDPDASNRSSLGRQRDVITFLQKKFDFEPQTMRNYLRRRKYELLQRDQRFNALRLEKLDIDLAAAHFICHRGGAVKFINNDRWIEADKTRNVPFLPKTKTPGLHVEAIDLSNVNIVYEGFDNLIGLKHIKSLNLSGCQFVDDWCLARLHNFKDSLLHLDISGCPRVSENGIGSFHHLTNLRKLNLSNLPNVVCKQLTAIHLEEELPNLYIEGVNYSPEQAEKEFSESDDIIKKRFNRKAEDFDIGYLANRVVGLKKFEKLLSYLPATSEGSFVEKVFPRRHRHKEVTEW